jgi:hypothetical protein
MNPPRWQEIERLYHQAQARPPGAARAAFLAEAPRGRTDHTTDASCFSTVRSAAAAISGSCHQRAVRHLVR